ncbi:glycerophosphodiester phosphodiesterase [Patescibacteria group bacterium]
MALRIGHRGACGHEPENTLESVKKAVFFGVDYVEIDVRLTKDTQFILMHDETLEGTTNGKGVISDMTLDEISQYRIKENNLLIPSFQEVIEYIDGKTKILIDIKDKESGGAIVELVKNNGIQNNVIAASIFTKTLKDIKHLAPEIPVGLTYPLPNIFPHKLLQCIIDLRQKDLQVEYIHLYYRLASKYLVNHLHSKGFKINVWTVNSPRDIQKMKDHEVDGIISNYPDRI